MNSHKQERGGVVSFITITLALAGLLAGGLYWSKHQARVAREGDVPSVAVNQPSSTADEKEAANDGTTSESATPAQSSTSTGHTSSVATTGPSTVAASGPSDVVMTTIGLMALTGAGYAFMSSRRTLARSALGN